MATGFNQSIVIAARAAEINPKLTPAELKSIAQQIVNGAPTKPLSKAATKALQGIAEAGKAALKATAKKILPGLMFLSAAMAAKRGWAGEGNYGKGAWGAGSEVLRDLVGADTVEQIVFPKIIDTVDGASRPRRPEPEGSHEKTLPSQAWPRVRYGDRSTNPLTRSVIRLKRPIHSNDERRGAKSNRGGNSLPESASVEFFNSTIKSGLSMWALAAPRAATRLPRMSATLSTCNR